ncbi:MULTISPECIES: SPFH domain-containing protein [Flavobacterium]|uniref:SPFH domain-containing protein n=1 Tax=Flavobacterium jumunjinense TaxID=998845 RepID=A0ABV5GMB9_9FLAO|nr:MULTISPECIES: SPFH domain-containing protein [Flavobacterium]
MGLFDFIRNEFIEVIDWVDNSIDTVIWKFQDKGNNIKNGAQLTVRESQVALLMNEGEFGDVYESGRFSLTTNNMPITTTLKSWKYGFDSPFKVDVYFANTKQFTNLKWGTSGAVMLQDSQLGQIRLKSFGSFAIKINDIKKVITQFSGTNPYIKIATIEETLKKCIASKLAEGLARANISVFELASKFTEIGAIIKPILQLEMDVFGIELTYFYIESVSLPEEVEKMIDKKTELNILRGNLNEFNQMQSGIALEKMAENEGTIGAMGAGIILNNTLGQQAQNTNTTNKTELLDVLKQLGELKNNGVLTEEEFNTKKKEILSKL